MTGRRIADLTDAELAAAERDMAPKAPKAPRRPSPADQARRARQRTLQARREAEIVLPGGWTLRPDLMTGGRPESWKLDGPSQPSRYYADLELAIRAWAGNLDSWIAKHRPRSSR